MQILSTSWPVKRTTICLHIRRDNLYNYTNKKWPKISDKFSDENEKVSTISSCLLIHPMAFLFFYLKGRCLRCAKRFSLCFAVVFFDELANSMNFNPAFSRGVSMENLPRRRFAGTCCACCSWFTNCKHCFIDDEWTHNSISWIIHNAWKCTLVISDKVHVAWKRKMLHDVIGGHQAHIHEKIDLFIACVAGVRKGRGKELRRASKREGGGRRGTPARKPLF